MGTVQVSEDTKILLLKLAAKLQQKWGRKASIDDAIRYLFRQRRNDNLLMSFYGCLKENDVRDAHKILKELREEERKRLETLESEVRS
ncbi:MAG: antitoxin VapB family protein [Candidatus Helarchaeota archaeon]